MQRQEINLIDSLNSLADIDGIMHFKLFLMLLLEISNKSTTDDTLFVLEMAKIWDKYIDVNDSGNILEMEWLSIMKILNNDLNHAESVDIFITMDKDNDGFIEKHDFILFSVMTPESDRLSKLQTILVQILLDLC